MAGNIITAIEITDMVRHWLVAEPNGYHGSGYGSDLKSYLNRPMTAGMGDTLIAKMIEDIPILSALPPNSINLYVYDRDFESKSLVIDILGEQIELTLPRTVQQ